MYIYAFVRGGGTVTHNTSFNAVLPLYKYCTYDCTMTCDIARNVSQGSTCDRIPTNDVVS